MLLVGQESDLPLDAKLCDVKKLFSHLSISHASEWLCKTQGPTRCLRNGAPPTSAPGRLKSSWPQKQLLGHLGTKWHFSPFFPSFFPEVSAAIWGVCRQNSGAFGEEGPSPDVIKAMWMMFSWVENRVILPPDRAHKYNLSFASKAVNED